MRIIALLDEADVIKHLSPRNIKPEAFSSAGADPT
jgi:hypothetical protein